MSEVTSSKLNYLDAKKRAVSSKASRVLQTPINGAIQTANGTTVIQIPGSQVATYLDFQNSYLKFKVTNKSTNGGDAQLYVENAYQMIERITIQSDGSTLSDISNYGSLVNQYLTTESGTNFVGGFGKVLFGSSAPSKYDDLVKIEKSNGSQFFAVPLVLTNLYSSSKYIPLCGRSNLQIRIHWAGVSKGVTTDTSIVNDVDVEFSDIAFVTSVIRLNAQADAMVRMNTNDRYELICSDFKSASISLPSGSTQLTMPLGFSCSSLDRVSWAMYPALLTTKCVHGCRAVSNLTDFNLNINGESLPAIPIKVGADNRAEFVAEIGVASNSLADFNHPSNISPEFLKTDPTGAHTTTYGGFKTQYGNAVFMIDSESMRPHSDGDNALYSGISTIGAVTQLRASFSAGTARAYTVLAFGQYTQALSLDMAGSQTWVVSV